VEYRRWEDYFWPGTNVLRNKLNIDNAIVLGFVETQVSHIRIFERVMTGQPSGDFDYARMRDIHRQLFGEIYDWAGEPRVVPENPMTKRGPDVVNHKVGDPGAPTVVYRYYPGPNVAAAAETLYARLADEQWLTGLDQDRFVTRLSRYWGAANEIHSFREGNTRSQLVYFHELARNAGYQLGLPSLFEERRKDFIAARFHGQANGHYGRLEGLLAETVEPRESVELTQREQRWAASLVERAEEAQEFLEGPPSGGGLEL
jgi:cell filamentation protein